MFWDGYCEFVMLAMVIVTFAMLLYCLGMVAVIFWRVWLWNIFV